MRQQDDTVSSMRAIVIANNKGRIDDQIKLCEDLGIEALFIVGEDVPYTGKFTMIRVEREPGVWPKYLRIISYFERRNSEIILKWLKRKYGELGKAVSRFKPDVVIANGDRQAGFEQAVLKYAHDRHIKIIVPYFTYSGPEGCIWMRKNKNNPLVYRRLITPQVYDDVARKYPLHFRENCLFYTPSQTIAYDRFGSLTKNPWRIGYGLADYVCVNNINTRNIYTRDGVERGKIRITGDFSYDQLFKAYLNRKSIKRKIIQKYGLKKDRKIILVSLPQMWEHNMIGKKKHFEGIKFICGTLEKTGHNILVSLHPKMRRDDYKFLEREGRIKIVDERLSEVLPCADMFTATYSSTVVWAVICGINSLVLDFWNLNYSIFRYLESLVNVNSMDKLRPCIESTIRKKVDFSSDWKRLSRKQVFDGKTIDRYRRLLEEASR